MQGEETGNQRGGGRRREEEKFESRGHNIRKVKQEVWNREDEGEGRKEEEDKKTKRKVRYTKLGWNSKE